MTDSENGVLAAFEAWQEAWRQIDVAGMKSLWKQDFDHLVYQPEDQPQPFRTWQEISDYWDAAPSVLESVVEWKSVEHDLSVCSDIAILFTRLSTDLRVQGVSEPFDGDVRCTLIFNRSGAEWLLIHYHESRAIDLAEALPELAGKDEVG
ncbi:MAG: nuclear transport factor 2 family protein [Actinobacteria bacterium]|nr:nuclear transport factor 2 family protein [Actinomycetota bacterium]